MTDRTPAEIRARLHEIMDQVRKAESLPDRNTIWQDLADVYSLLGLLMEGSGKAWAALRTSVALQERGAAAVQNAFRELDQHREAVRSLYSGADQYLRAIQLGGYAAAFGTWGFTHDYLGPAVELWTALLLLFSAFFFIGWEVVKGSVVSYELTELHRLTDSVESLLSSRLERMLGRSKRLREWLPRARFGVWCLSVGPAFVAIVLLACALAAELFSNYVAELLARF